MLMRDWRKGSTFPRWLAGGRRARLAMAIPFWLMSYSVVIVVTLLTADDSAAPWLPTNAGESEFWLVIAALFLAACVGAFVYAAVGARRARVRRPRSGRLVENDGAPKPLPRELNSYFLGTAWTLTGRRLWTFGLLIYAPIVPIVWLSLTLDAGEPLMGGIPWYTDDSSWLNVWLVAHCCFWMMWAFVLKGREVRRGKERMKVADDYLAIREDRLNAEFEAMCEKFFQEQLDWRGQKTEELYRQILDQQAKGLLPCPNCHDQGEHGKSA